MLRICTSRRVDRLPAVPVLKPRLATESSRWWAMAFGRMHYSNIKYPAVCFRFDAGKCLRPVSTILNSARPAHTPPVSRRVFVSKHTFMAYSYPLGNDSQTCRQTLACDVVVLALSMVCFQFMLDQIHSRRRPYWHRSCGQPPPINKGRQPSAARKANAGNNRNAPVIGRH